jgi:DNA-binding GntR family transcriptional regulator
MDAARHDPLVWIRRHDEFHQFICEIGNRLRLAHEVARIRNAVQPYVLMYMRVYDTIEMPGLEHSSLIEALASGDVELAEKVMRDHVTKPGAGIVEFLRQREANKDALSKVDRLEISPTKSEEMPAASSI